MKLLNALGVQVFTAQLSTVAFNSIIAESASVQLDLDLCIFTPRARPYPWLPQLGSNIHGDDSAPMVPQTIHFAGWRCMFGSFPLHFTPCLFSLRVRHR
jgi:hypothetical protein